jgi:hypothetical protein
MLVIAGVWWITNGDSPLDGKTVRFVLRDGDRADDKQRAGNVGGALSDADRRAMEARGQDAAALETAQPGSKSDEAALAVWSGTVRARDGTPIAGATVKVRWRSFERTGDDQFVDVGDWMTLTTGPDGLIAFPFKAGGVWELEVCAPGYGKEKFAVEGQGSQDLTLDRASGVDGRVLGKDRQPMSGARVIFENANESYEGVTDQDGRFHFDGVGARAARIHISDNRFMATTQPVDYLIPGQTWSLSDVLVEAGFSLSGEVINASSLGPIAGSQVQLVDRVTGLLVSIGYTDAMGHFSFQSLNPLHQYVVTAWGFGYRYDTQPLSFGVDTNIQLPVNPTWTLGVVVRDSAGAPAAGAHVALTRQDGLPISEGQQTVTAQSNGQGLVAFGGLSPNLSYKVRLSKTGLATLELGSITSAWNSTIPLIVNLPVARQIYGRVLDEDGNGVGSVTVRALRTDAVPAPALFVMSDASGNFAFDHLAPGEVSLVTFKSGYDNSRLVLAVPEAGSDEIVTMTIPLLNIIPIIR